MAGLHTRRDTALVEQDRQGDLLSDWKQDDGRRRVGRCGSHALAAAAAVRTTVCLQNVSLANYDLSADGEQFLMVKDEAGSGRLNVVLNWTEELKRLVPIR
jgi:hypothetical protein